MASGPCVLCGATDYPLSCGGPFICPMCDMGISPEVTRLRREVVAPLEHDLAVAHDYIKALEQRIAALTAERDPLAAALREALESVRSWHHSSMSCDDACPCVTRDFPRGDVDAALDAQNEEADRA